MRRFFGTLMVCGVATFLCGGTLAAQDRPSGAGPMGLPPVMAALDENADGELSTSEIEGASAALKSLDKNNDGRLDGEELRPRGRGRGEGSGPGDAPEGGPGPGPGGPGGDPGAFMERLKQADSNGDGKISKDEAPERLKNNFDRLDGNGDGFIDEQEMRTMSDRRGGRRGPGGPDGPPEGGTAGAAGGPGGRGFGPEAMIDRMFQFDADGDGKLTREELAKMAEQFGGRLGAARGGDNAGDRPEGGQGQGQRRRPQRPDGNN
jgi:collagen type III alpha